MADSLAVEPFLTQLASHGIMIIAGGIPKGKGSTTAAQMTAGIDWIDREESWYRNIR